MNGIGFTIRPAGAGDAGALARVHVDAWRRFYERAGTLVEIGGSGNWYRELV